MWPRCGRPVVEPTRTLLPPPCWWNWPGPTALSSTSEKIGAIFKTAIFSLLRELIRTKLDLEMAADETMAKIALTIKPDMVTLVPEKRQELTTEGGLDVAGHSDRIQQIVTLLHDGGIPVSLFIEPDLAQVKAAHRVSADFVELHTGRYANARRSKEADAEVEAITQAAKLSYKLGMGVNAGHGLDYRNVTRLTHIPEIVEYNIGHSIIARAVLVGLDQAVREMKALLS